MPIFLPIECIDAVFADRIDRLDVVTSADLRSAFIARDLCRLTLELKRISSYVVASLEP